MAYCPQCGTELSGDPTFCPECGTNLAEGGDEIGAATGSSGGGSPDGNDEGLTATLPLMEPGSRVRNVVVGFGYALLILVIIGAAAPDDGTTDTAPATTTTVTSTAASTTTSPTTTSTTTSPTTSTTTRSSTATATTTTTVSTTQTSTTTPTATTTATPAPDLESYSHSGNGQTATDAISLEDGLATVHLSHNGDSNFIVKLVNTQTGDEQYLVNDIGEFDGTVATYTPNGEFVLDIQANGQWTAEIHQPRYSPSEVESLPAELTGSDYAMLGPHQFEGATRLSYDAETDSNVIIYLLNHEGGMVNVLVNKIGPADGSTVFSANGVGLIYVETTGDWVIRVEQA